MKTPETVLDDLRLQVDERLKEVVAGIRTEELRRAIAPLLRSGKRIRPLVTLLASEAAGGQGSQALEAAVSVELLHTASLIHDDICDHATLRRGQPSIHTAYGMNAAVLAGDLLVALAYERILAVPSGGVELVAMLTSAVRLMALIEGTRS